MSDLSLINESFPDHPGLDVAVSHALLDSVANGEIGPLFRLHAARPVLAFGMADRLQSGYGHAVRIAAAHGFNPVERLAGGRAAVFHEQTLAFSWATPQDDPKTGITERFEAISGMIQTSLSNLGFDARIGEVPGEYCPGAHSINLGGTTKVMGVGQRLTRKAAHVGGVIVVDGVDRIRDVLIPVYRALAFDWDPRTTGSLAAQSQGLTIETVREAIVAVLGEHFDIVDASVPEAVVDRARSLVDYHLPKVA